MFRIFISSTFRDLQEHRKAVIEALQKADLAPVAMEFFGTQSDDARQGSLKEVEKAELFVGIYAHRYGYRPDDSRSVTEMEYDEAVRLKIPTLVFIVQDDYRVGVLGEFAETDDESHMLLTMFKRRLRRHILEIQGFTTPDDLAKMVASAVLRWILNNRPELTTADNARSATVTNTTTINADTVERAITGGEFTNSTIKFGDSYRPSADPSMPTRRENDD